MSSKRKPIYPFVPRSTATLFPGQFWAIPLSDGFFGCGRVIELKPADQVGARRLFLAGVLDWHAEEPPTFESIAGAGCLAQGQAHLKVITESGGAILGHRPLELDDIEPWVFRRTWFDVNSYVSKGFKVLRPQEPSDSSLPVLDTWGYGVSAIIAEKRFIGKAS